MAKHYEIDDTTPLTEKEFRTLIESIPGFVTVYLKTLGGHHIKIRGKSLIEDDYIMVDRTYGGRTTVTDCTWGIRFNDTLPGRFAETVGRELKPVTEDVILNGKKVGYWIGDTFYSTIDEPVARKLNWGDAVSEWEFIDEAFGNFIVSTWIRMWGVGTSMMLSDDEVLSAYSNFEATLYQPMFKWERASFYGDGSPWSNHVMLVNSAEGDELGYVWPCAPITADKPNSYDTGGHVLSYATYNRKRDAIQSAEEQFLAGGWKPDGTKKEPVGVWDYVNTETFEKEVDGKSRKKTFTVYKYRRNGRVLGSVAHNLGTNHDVFLATVGGVSVKSENQEKLTLETAKKLVEDFVLKQAKEIAALDN
jgi:hypothetical protein